MHSAFMPRSQAPEQAARASANSLAIAQDWQTRDFVESVSLGVAELTTFLNEFGKLAAKALVHAH